MGNTPSLHDQLIDVKLNVKTLERAEKKCQKNRTKQLASVKKAIKEGNVEGARIYAENAIREKQQGAQRTCMHSRAHARTTSGPRRRRGLTALEPPPPRRAELSKAGVSFGCGGEPDRNRHHDAGDLQVDGDGGADHELGARVDGRGENLPDDVAVRGGVREHGSGNRNNAVDHGLGHFIADAGRPGGRPHPAGCRPTQP
mmetsp:Transcript_5513/g.12240  ORF Transcript_5513/g.12240 Transcript_5513/m.12240 type:complete len:200 (+) Transcript_5513:79-678(+)